MKRHLRSMMHTGTRTLIEVAKASGNEYGSIAHTVDPACHYPITWGMPVDVPVRDPVAAAISWIHQRLPHHLADYNRLCAWHNNNPNVRLIKIEDVDWPVRVGSTPDYFGLRARFLDGGEPFPKEMFKQVSPVTLEWLRTVYGYNV